MRFNIIHMGAGGNKSRLFFSFDVEINLSLSINGKDKLRVLHSSIPSIIDDLRKIIIDWEGEILNEVCR